MRTDISDHATQQLPAEKTPPGRAKTKNDPTPDYATQLLPAHKATPRRKNILLPAVLLLLALLVSTGTLVLQRIDPGVLDFGLWSTHLPASDYFIQPPLDPNKVDQLRHLTSHMQYKQLASLYVSRMSLDEELGQLIMVEYDEPTYSADLDTMLTKLHAGGVIMYEFQMNSFDQTKNDIAQMQKRATLPLLISADEEGGPWIHRLSHIYPLRMSAIDIYNTGKPEVATSEGHKVAHDLLSVGINVNLAPDVDVALIPGPDQVTRTYGFTVDSVIKFAGPYMKAMQGDGVIACIKHFPGLGDASTDAHRGLPVVTRTKEQLYSVEMATFKHFIQSPDKLENPGMIMPTDVLMPAIDPVMPAELSHTFITDILRKEFGYDGVVLTDALYMKGVKVNGSELTLGQAAVMAINAGDDMLLGSIGSAQMLEMINALKAGLKDGTVSKARIDEAATRIIALKMQSHLMAAVPPQNSY